MKTETIDGLEYQVMEGTGEATDCEQCAFYDDDDLCIVSCCSADERDDEEHVYFVELGVTE